MAIRDDNKPPKTKGSLTQSADYKIDRIGNISNVSKTVSNMQKDVKQRITETKRDIDDYKDISMVQSSMVKVLEKLEGTVAAIGKGIKLITVDTAKATKDAVSQYGRAISEDISFNRQNTVAMALAKTTPIFGYFAAKFMETSVFKSATERMKRSIGNAFSGIVNLVKRGVKREESSRGKISSRNISKSINKQLTKENIPHMAKGGVVERGGMARLHAAEVVMPVEKFLSRIDESIEINRKLAKISEFSQLTTLSRLNKYAMSIDPSRQKVGLFKGFFRALKDVETQYREPANVRMLRAVLAIQDVLGAQIGKTRQIWYRMLIEHPTLRNISFALRVVSGSFRNLGGFIYQFFKGRGGYQSHLSRNKNPLAATAENIGVLYTGTMWRLDNIAIFTRMTAEATRDLAGAVTGKKYPPVQGISTGVWSIFGAARGVLNWSTKQTVKLLGEVLGKQNLAASIAEALTKERYLPTSTRDRLLRETYGGPKEEEPLTSKEDLALHKKFGRWFRRALTSVKEKGNQISLPFMGEKERRPSFYEIIEKWSKAYFEDREDNQKYFPIQEKRQKLLLEYNEQQTKGFSSLIKKFKSSKILMWLLTLGGILKTALSTLFNNTLGKFFGKNSLIIRMLSKLGLGKLFGKTGILTKYLPMLAKLSGVASIALGGWQMFKDVKAAQSLDWRNKAGEKLGGVSKGIGAALGGTQKGAAGAWAGAKKGALIGAGIGTLFGPGIGTAIGGAIGAIAGGILGFIGGENIARAMSYLGKKIKAISKAVWKFVTWPYTAIWELIKKAKETIFGDTKVFSKEGILLATKAYFKYIAFWPVTLGKFLVDKIKSWWSKKKDDESTTSNVTSSLNSIASFPNKVLINIKKYIVKTFKWKNIKETLKVGVQKLTDMFTWIGGLFGKIKDLIKENVSKIPGIKWLFGDDEKEILNESISSAANFSKKANKYATAQAKNITGFYKDNEGNIIGLGSKIKERSIRAADRGKIVLNDAQLMLSNGDMIVDKLGKVITKTSDKISDTTMKSAGVVATTVSNITNNVVSSTNTTSVGGGNRGSSTPDRDYFNNIVYTGNYR